MPRSPGPWLASLCLLLLVAQPATGQVRDLLEQLLGGGGGKIESVETAGSGGSTVTLRVTYSGVEDPADVELTARVLDVHLRRLDGFSAGPVAIEEGDGTVELELAYAGAESVTSASVELRFERDGALVVRALHPLIRPWSGSGGGSSESLAPQDEPSDEPQPLLEHEPEEIVIEPLPLGDTPTGDETVAGGGGSSEAGGGSSGGGSSSGGGTLGTIERPGPILTGPILRHDVLLLMQPILGYLWADQPSGGSYSPAANYAYNSAGGGVTVSRAGTGRYGIQLQKLGGNGAKAGGLMVTAYGGDSARCQVSTWNTSAAGFQGTVQCVAPGGAAADSRFTALAVLALGANRLGYALADRPTTPSYTPADRYSSTPGGGVSVGRQGTGRYTVTFPGLMENAPDRGNVQVASRGTAGEYCKVANWNPGAGGGLAVTVRCFAAGGQPSDAAFSVLAVAASANAGNLAYTYASQPATQSYTPIAQLTASPGAATVTRSGQGAYSVQLGGPGGSRGGTVQVTAVGGGSEWCKVVNWSAGGQGVTARVRCFAANGQPADSQFGMLVVR